MFLFLIATVGAVSVLFGSVEGTEISETFRNISGNEWRVRVSALLLIVAGISTLILAAMLYAVTKRADRNLAILALSCRAVEAALYAVATMSALALLSLSEESTRASADELTAAYALGDLALNLDSWETNVGAIFFAVGSALYSYLFLKARSVPIVLAVLGLLASLALVVGVPLQTAAGRDTVEGASAVIWIPMIIFEITTGLWLLIKGANVLELERGEQVNATPAQVR
jgi:hypothetical protein